MGGHFNGCCSEADLHAAFPIDLMETAAAESRDIAPLHQVLAIVGEQGKNRLKRFHWGLVPYWAKNKTMGPQLINARAETLASKPSFRNAFRQRRCLIPANGFYESRMEKGRQQSVYFTLPTKSPFAIAGLWEQWDNHGNADSTYLSCTIVTTVASQSVKPFHHRMPAILPPGAYTAWLDPQNRNIKALETILRNEIIGELIHRPVSRGVNDGQHNHPDNIRPQTQLELDF